MSSARPSSSVNVTPPSFTSLTAAVWSVDEAKSGVVAGPADTVALTQFDPVPSENPIHIESEYSYSV